MPITQYYVISAVGILTAELNGKLGTQEKYFYKKFRKFDETCYVMLCYINVTFLGTSIYHELSVSQSCLLSFLCNPYISFQNSPAFFSGPRYIHFAIWQFTWLQTY